MGDRTPRSGMLLLDEAGVVRFVSSGARMIGGWGDGLVGMSWLHTFPQGAQASGSRLLQDAERGPASHLGPRGPDGRLLASTLERTEDGYVETIVEAARDVTSSTDALRLEQLSTALAATRSVPEVVDVFVTEALPALGGRAGAVGLVSDDGKALEFVDGLRGQVAVPEHYRRLDLASSILVRHALESGRTVWFENLEQYRAMSGRSSAPLEELDVEAFALIPLVLGGRTVGVLVFDFAPTGLTDRQRRFAEAVALACAQALDRVRLLEHERHARARAADAERRLRRMTELLPVILWSTDRDGRLTYVNEERARAYFGVGFERLRDELVEHIHPDDRLSSLREADSARQARRGYEVEQRLRRYDGVWRWHLVRTVPLLDEQGAFAGWYGIATDIDDQKRAREELTESRQRLGLALQAGGMVAWEFDFNTRMLTPTAWSSGVEAGRPPGPPRTYEQVEADIHPDDRRRVIDAFRRGYEQRAEFNETYRRKVGNEWRWHASRAIFPTDATGDVPFAIGVTRDVTEGKNAELQLRESESRFRRLAEALPIIVWEADVHGRTTYLNAAWRQFTGINLDVHEQPEREAMHPDDRETVRVAWRVAMREERSGRSEFRLRRRDGQYRWHLGRLEPVRDDAGAVTHWVGGATDIDDQKRALVAREELLARTREAVHAREVFLAVAAHELRTPLTPLRLHLEATLRRARTMPQVPEKFLGRVEAAHRQVLRLQMLVEGLLDVSRIAGGRLELHLEDLDLAALVQEIVERQRPEHGERLIEVDAPEELRGRFDRLRVEQVLTNLLSNALKYGLGKPVRVELEGTERRVRLRVIDQGVGIAERDQSRIFERFERAGGELPHGGLGLGLWIVQQLVTSMHGTIRVQSAPGKGSTFEVVLPRIVDA